MSTGTFFFNLLARDSVKAAVDTSKSVDELVSRLRRLGRPARDFPLAVAGALASEGRVDEAASLVSELDQEWRAERQGSSAIVEELACLRWMQGARSEAVSAVERRWMEVMRGRRAWFSDCGIRLFALRLYFSARLGDMQLASSQLAETNEYFAHIPVRGWEPFAAFAIGKTSRDDLIRALVGSQNLSNVKRSVWRSGGMVSRVHFAFFLIASLRLMGKDVSAGREALVEATSIPYSFCQIAAAFARLEQGEL